jgi:hypothetical protein
MQLSPRSVRSYSSECRAQSILCILFVPRIETRRRAGKSRSAVAIEDVRLPRAAPQSSVCDFRHHAIPDRARNDLPPTPPTPLTQSKARRPASTNYRHFAVR